MGAQIMTNSSFREVLSGFSISELMSPKVLTVYEGWSIKRLAGFFVKHGISGAPVIAADDELVGVVTQSDVVRFETRTMTDSELENLSQFYCGPFGGKLGDDDIRHLRERANENCTVNAIMTPEVLSMDIGASVAEACELIVNKHIHRLFITDNGQLVGVVTARDILQKLVLA